jgi:hypothetical protein
VQVIHPDQGIYLPMLRHLKNALASFHHIYTTNYDLWIYWSIMRGPSGFNDYFRLDPCRVPGQWTCFSPVGARSLELASNVLYLHGALHLYETPWGQTVKLSSSVDEGRLLDRFANSNERVGPVAPLFVSEGTWEQKAAAIGRSDYLSLAFDHFGERQGPLVVFGHSLSDSDGHIVRAIEAGSPPQSQSASGEAATTRQRRRASLGCFLPTKSCYTAPRLTP